MKRRIAIWTVAAVSMVAAVANAAPSAQQVAATYANFDFSDCTPNSGISCAVRFATAAGLLTPMTRHRNQEVLNPRALMRNPDPEWLPGWDWLKDGSSPSDAWTAINALVAASQQRNALASCLAKFKTADAKLREAEDKLAAAVATIDAVSDPYQRLPGLLALRQSPDAASPAARFGLERAILAAFQATGRDFLYDQYALSSQDLAQLRARGDDATERDAYCMRKVFSADTSAYDRNFRKFNPVKPVFSPERIKQVTATIAELTAAARKQLEHKAASIPGLIHNRVDLRDAPLPVVTAVSRDGDKTIVEMQRTYETSNEVDCKEIHPRKVLRVADDGVVYYAHKCKQEKLRYDTTDLVTFDMLPAGVTIAKGDLLSMWYVVDSKQEQALVNKPLKKHFKEQRKLTALHLISVHTADANVKHGPYLEE